MSPTVLLLSSKISDRTGPGIQGAISARSVFQPAPDQAFARVRPAFLQIDPRGQIQRFLVSERGVAQGHVGLEKAGHQIDAMQAGALVQGAHGRGHAGPLAGSACHASR